jgi:hypothetical protein
MAKNINEKRHGNISVIGVIMAYVMKANGLGIGGIGEMKAENGESHQPKKISWQ